MSARQKPTCAGARFSSPTTTVSAPNLTPAGSPGGRRSSSRCTASPRCSTAKTGPGRSASCTTGTHGSPTDCSPCFAPRAGRSWATTNPTRSVTRVTTRFRSTGSSARFRMSRSKSARICWLTRPARLGGLNAWRARFARLNFCSVRLRDLVRENFEADQRTGTERVTDGDVGGVAAAGNEHPTDARNVVARIERVPSAAEVRLEPAREVHRSVWRRYANVAEIAGAVARRNVHATAKCDRQMREVTADPPAFLEGLRGRFTGTRVLVTESDMLVDEIADRLNPRPAGWKSSEQVPGGLGQMVGFAISATQKKDQRFFGQVLDRMLTGAGGDFVGLAGVSNDSGAGDSDAALGSHDPGAPVSEPVAICGNRHARIGSQKIRNDYIRCARVMDVQVQNHRSGLRTFVNQLVTDSDLHTQALYCPSPARAGSVERNS